MNLEEVIPMEGHSTRVMICPCHLKAEPSLMLLGNQWKGGKDTNGERLSFLFKGTGLPWGGSPWGLSTAPLVYTTIFGIYYILLCLMVKVNRKLCPPFTGKPT